MSLTSEQITAEIRTRFADQEISIEKVELRSYPDESNFVAYVDEKALTRAVEVANDLDRWLAEHELRAFVVVRRSSVVPIQTSPPLMTGVADERATEFTRLISARSRVSQSQPSLAYVRDASANLSAITAPRHHLVFGRRGAGKSALLIEAQRQVESAGDLSVWVNVQSLRREDPHRVFLYIADDVLSRLSATLAQERTTSQAAVLVAELSEEIHGLLSNVTVDTLAIERLVPRIQRSLRRALEVLGRSLFVFIDDFYYVPRSSQPQILDMLHSCVRDCDAWLKLASIRHLTRWYITQGYSVDRTFAGQVALHGRSALGRSRLGGCPPEPGSTESHF